MADLGMLRREILVGYGVAGFLAVLVPVHIWHGPGDVFFAIGVVMVLCVINIVGVTEAAALNVALAVTDFATQLLLVIIGGVLVFSGAR